MRFTGGERQRRRHALRARDLCALFPQPHEAPGLFVEWARSTLQRLGCSAELVRVPQRRLLFDTASNTTQVSFYFAHTAERAQRLVYPLRSGGHPERNLALAETRLAFFVRADRRAGIQWDGVTLQPADLRVGIVGGGVEEALAMAAGWKLDRATHPGPRRRS